MTQRQDEHLFTKGNSNEMALMSIMSILCNQYVLLWQSSTMYSVLIQRRGRGACDVMGGEASSECDVEKCRGCSARHVGGVGAASKEQKLGSVGYVEHLVDRDVESDRHDS